MTTTVPALIGSAEAAKILDRDRSVVNKMAAEGRLKSVVKGDGKTGARIFRRSHVLKLKRQLDAAQSTTSTR